MTIYGPKMPLALLYIIAAHGCRMTEVPDASESDRRTCSGVFAERARELVLAGFFDRAEGTRIISPIEALQVLLLLYVWWTPTGRAPDIFPLLERTVELAVQICVPEPTGRHVSMIVEPTSAQEWIWIEMLTRTWIHVANVDVMSASMSGREALFRYFDFPVRTPSHEHFFDQDAVEDAFAARAQDASPSLTLDFSLLKGIPELRRQHVNAIVTAIFSFRASYTPLSMINSFLRDLRNQMRSFADKHGIEPLVLVSRDPSEDTPSESAFRHQMTIIESIGQDIYDALPSDIGQGLSHGNATNLFANWTNYFSSRSYLHAFLPNCFFFRTLMLESFIQGGASFASPLLFSSPLFVKIMESAIVVVRLAEFILADDPNLDLLSFTVAAVMLRVGYLFLATFRVTRSAGFVETESVEQDIRVVAEVLDRIGKNYPPVVTKLAVGFRKAMVAAGVSRVEAAPLAVDLDLVTEEGSSGEESLSDGSGDPAHLTFARTARKSENLLQGIVR